MRQGDLEGGVGPQGGYPSTNFTASLFETKQIRHNFIKKVYSLLSIQLIITTAIIALFTLHPEIHAWTLKNSWFHLTTFVIAFVVLIAITLMDKLRRKHPHNLIILFVFTVVESLMLASITVMFKTTSILMAAGITVSICLVLTIFAMQTRYDFTSKLGIMTVILTVLFISIIILSFFRLPDPFVLLIAAVMAIVMGIFLVIDTQMIVGGTHSIQMSPEEYVFAAINLYLDIVNMFIYILMLLGRE